jgi:hypothetical protein
VSDLCEQGIITRLTDTSSLPKRMAAFEEGREEESRAEDREEELLDRPMVQMATEEVL